MAWIILVLAGLFEIGWAIGLKYTEGFTRLWPSVNQRPILSTSQRPIISTFSVC